MTQSTPVSEKSIRIPSEYNPSQHPLPTLSGSTALWIGCFQAMACDCELLMEGVSEQQASRLLLKAARETWRIETKFSRYRNDNVMAKINNLNGQSISVDDETASLLDFSEQCYQLSDGLFDITSGVLRKIWCFDGGDQIPNGRQIRDVLQNVGWEKLSWQRPLVSLKPGMELDFGGIGKEYAVDKTAQVLSMECAHFARSAFVVNFGGDLACSGPRLNGKAWVIGVESSEHDAATVATVSLSHGAVATSGDSQRYLLKDGIRYSHILNPKTGASVPNSPRAISVAAPSCLQAGMFSTLAMLHGEEAEAFLQSQDVQYWVQ